MQLAKIKLLLGEHFFAQSLAKTYIGVFENAPSLLM